MTVLILPEPGSGYGVELQTARTIALAGKDPENNCSVFVYGYLRMRVCFLACQTESQNTQNFWPCIKEAGYVETPAEVCANLEQLLDVGWTDQ